MEKRKLHLTTKELFNLVSFLVIGCVVFSVGVVNILEKDYISGLILTLIGCSIVFKKVYLSDLSRVYFYYNRLTIRINHVHHLHKIIEDMRYKIGAYVNIDNTGLKLKPGLAKYVQRLYRIGQYNLEMANKYFKKIEKINTSFPYLLNCISEKLDSILQFKTLFDAHTDAGSGNQINEQ